MIHLHFLMGMYRVTQKNGNFWKTQQKLKKSKKKKFIDRNWTITTCLLRDSNPHYHCLKITSCRWRPPPRMHSFTATTHFKSSRSCVSLCVCCMFCRMRLRRILQNIRYNHVIITCQTQDLNTRYHAIKKSDILCYYLVLFILKDHLLTARIIKHSSVRRCVKNSEGLGRKRAVEGREFLRILLLVVSSLNLRVDG